MPKRMMVVIGTRPECIKLAPVIKALRDRPTDFVTILCSSGQHHEMLEQTLDGFGLIADEQLAVMRPNQTLPELTASLLGALSQAVVRAKPDWIIVQGDTTTAFVAGLCAYYERVRVAHVEAGLRSFDPFNPFPEEINRRLLGAIADLHFAPTQRACEALRGEGVPANRIHLSGNTIVDALQVLRKELETPGGLARVSPEIRGLAAGSERIVLVTCHRRESFGEDLAAICRAVRRVAEGHRDCRVIYPVHLNPEVRAQSSKFLAATPNIQLTDPLPYHDLLHLLQHATLVMTDSGGIQEEAPSFGVPVLVLRRKTERPEGVEAGFAELVGTDEERIVARATAWLALPSREALRTRPNPYGDGRAADRIADILAATP